LAGWPCLPAGQLGDLCGGDSPKETAPAVTQVQMGSVVCHGHKHISDGALPSSGHWDGWQVLGVQSFNTGFPFTVTALTNFSNAGGDTRPDLIPGVTLVPSGGRHREQWFNPAAFRNPLPGFWGSSGRNIGTLPGGINVDFSLFKNFRLTETMRLQFRTEAFNLPNHANFRTITKAFDAPDQG
jgi:hypothetical protein